MNKLILTNAKKQNGITVLALGVTVIVMIIIAGTSISMLKGENGIITQATNAVLQTEIANAKETLQTLYAQYYMDSVMKEDESSIEGFLEYIENKGIATKIEDGKYYVEINGYIYELGLEGNNLTVAYVEEGTITGPNILAITATVEDTNITIKVKSVRMDGGTYYYYIGTNENNLTEDGSNQTGEYTFKITESATYYIKVVGVNSEGEEASKTIEVSAKFIPAATESNIKYTIKWENGTATLAFSSTIDYDIQVSKNGKNYTTTSTITGVNSGETVYVRLTDGTDYGEALAIEIKDTTAPTITLSSISAGTSTISLVATASDSESGIAGQAYSYYIATSQNELSTVSASGTNTTGEYTFTSLKQKTKYYIKITIKDNAGNEGEYTTTKETSELTFLSGDMTFTTAVWSGGTATSTLTNNTSYAMQYAIVKSGETVDLNDSTIWVDSSSSSVTLNTLAFGDKVYARITDGTNVAGYATLDLTTETVEPTIEIAIESKTSNSIKIKATATDNESGVVGQSYSYYISDSEVGLQSAAASSLNTTGEYEFTGLDQNTVYYIKVTIEDIAGNKGSATQSATTELIPTAVSSITVERSWSSNGTATVTLKTSENYTILYKTGTGNYQTYTSEIVVTNGTTLTVCLSDGKNQGEEYSVVISDTTGPFVTVTEDKSSKTSCSLTVTVEAIDEEAGMSDTPTYTYYIKKSSDTDYGAAVVVDSTGTSCKFDGLTAATSYDIKVVTTDKLGIEGSGTTSATTSTFLYYVDDITAKTTWNGDGTATTVLTNNTNYTMQYVIFKSGETIDTNTENWKTATSTTQTASTELSSGDTVYARITDGTNVAGYMIEKVNDTTKPEVEVTIDPEVNYTTEVTISVNATDSESGIPSSNAYSFDGGNTWTSENYKTYTQNTSGIIIQVIDRAGNVYTHNSIDITNIDRTGPQLTLSTNYTTSTLTVTVENVIDNGAGMNDTINYTYYMSTDSDEIKTITTGGTTTTDTSIEYTKLDQGKTYYIRVDVEDRLGNASSAYATITLSTVQTTGLTLNEATWSDGVATVVIENTSTYTLMYKTSNDSDWTTTTEGTVSVTPLKSGDTVYAKLSDGNNESSELERAVLDDTAPSITSVTQDPTEYTTGSVLITVNGASDTESGLPTDAYSFDGGNSWTSENYKSYSQNTSGILIKVRDVAGNIYTHNSIDITNIDTTGPSINITQKSKTTNSITVEVDASDTGVGMTSSPVYTYSYSTDGGTTYTEGVDTTSVVYTFSNLSSATEHKIKVVVADALGNQTEQTIDISTYDLVYSSGDITFSSVVWYNSVGTVTATNVSDYDMEYLVYGTSTEGLTDASVSDYIADDNNWIVADSSSIELEVLSGDTIYARLTDGTNVTNYVSSNITNLAAETYTDSELVSVTRSSYDILAVSVSSSQIEVRINNSQSSADTYNYYYKSIDDTEYKLAATNTYYSDVAIINLDEEDAGHIYKIKVLTLNSSGTTATKCQNTATVVAYDKIAAGETDSEYNRTYIDDSSEITVRRKNKSGEWETSTTNAGYTISVPATFKVSETAGTQSKGAVLSDAVGNEFVWIPVNDAIYDSTTPLPTGTGNASSRTYKPLAKLQTGYDSYYQSMVYTYNGALSYVNSSNTEIGKSSYREPSLVTGNASDGYTWDVTTSGGVWYDTASRKLC